MTLKILCIVSFFHFFYLRKRHILNISFNQIIIIILVFQGFYTKGKAGRHDFIFILQSIQPVTSLRH